MRVTIFDYGAGNLHSLAKALERGGVDVRVETDPVRAVDTDALVLPGVGAFGAAAERLAPGRAAMRDALERGLPASASASACSCCSTPATKATARGSASSPVA